MNPTSQAEKHPESLSQLLSGFEQSRHRVLGYLDRVERLFAIREPYVMSFVPENTDRFCRLRDEFSRLESTCPNPSSRLPLFGVPVGVKDIFHVNGFPTRAGSTLPLELLQGAEAESVQVLKSAGALLLGKTTTTEFAYFAPGPTRNPHNLEHTPGGSSSGSAAAVGAGLCPLALGTQTIGSVIRPASYCGVVGFKPTYGRISTAGVIPLAPSVDHVGFFTSDVAGAERVASVLCGGWIPEGGPPPMVLGVPQGPYLRETGQDGMRFFRQTCDRLRAEGCELRPVQMLSDFEEIVRRHETLVAAEAAMVHGRWFRDYSDRYHEKTSELIRKGQTIAPDVLETCRKSREQVRRDIVETMERFGLSALVTPASVGPAPRGLESTGDPIMNLPWTHAGLPVVSIPSGMSEGLPVGLQIVGSWMGDERLLRVAERIEGILHRHLDEKQEMV